MDSTMSISPDAGQSPYSQFSGNIQIAADIFKNVLNGN